MEHAETVVSVALAARRPRRPRQARLHAFQPVLVIAPLAGVPRVFDLQEPPKTCLRHGDIGLDAGPVAQLLGLGQALQQRARAAQVTHPLQAVGSQALQLLLTVGAGWAGLVLVQTAEEALHHLFGFLKPLGAKQLQGIAEQEVEAVRGGDGRGTREGHDLCRPVAFDQALDDVARGLHGALIALPPEARQFAAVEQPDDRRPVILTRQGHDPARQIPAAAALVRTGKGRLQRLAPEPLEIPNESSCGGGCC